MKQFAREWLKGRVSYPLRPTAWLVLESAEFENEKHGFYREVSPHLMDILLVPIYCLTNAMGLKVLLDPFMIPTFYFIQLDCHAAQVSAGTIPCKHVACG